MVVFVKNIKIKNKLYRNLNIVLLFITILCIVQILSYIFGISLIRLPSCSVDIINNLALSWIGSYIFYLIVVYLPEQRNLYYKNIYSFGYILIFLMHWKKIKKVFIGKENISKDDEIAFNNTLNNIDRKSSQYFWLGKIFEDINIILIRDFLYDARLIHYIDVINKNLYLLKENVDGKIDHYIDDDCSIDVLIFLDKYFSAIEMEWKKELDIANGSYEIPDEKKSI
jgi:hypothetical protein